MFDGFWLPTSLPRTFKIIVFPNEKQRIFKNSLFEVGMDFGCHLGSNLLPKSIKILLKSIPKRRSKIDRFWLRFLNDLGSVLGPKLEPCCPPFSLQDGPRSLQDAPKTPPRNFQDAPKDTKTPSRGPKGPQDASKIDFGWICHGFSMDF